MIPPDRQRRFGCQRHDEVGGAMQRRGGRGQLDGGEEPPPTGREDRQHPVLTGDGENVAE